MLKRIRGKPHPLSLISRSWTWLFASRFHRQDRTDGGVPFDSDLAGQAQAILIRHLCLTGRQLTEIPVMNFDPARGTACVAATSMQDVHSVVLQGQNQLRTLFNRIFPVTDHCQLWHGSDLLILYSVTIRYSIFPVLYDDC